MVARAHGDALVIERLTDILGAEPLEHEQKDAGLFRHGADEAQEGHARRPLHLIPPWASREAKKRGSRVLLTMQEVGFADVTGFLCKRSTFGRRRADIEKLIRMWFDSKRAT